MYFKLLFRSLHQNDNVFIPPEPTSCSLPTPALTDAVPLEQRVEAVKNFFSRGIVCN